MGEPASSWTPSGHCGLMAVDIAAFVIMREPTTFDNICAIRYIKC